MDVDLGARARAEVLLLLAWPITRVVVPCREQLRRASNAEISFTVVV